MVTELSSDTLVEWCAMDGKDLISQANLLLTHWPLGDG